MKNGYTPRQYAYVIAIDSLFDAERNRSGELDELTESEPMDCLNFRTRMEV